MTLHQPFKTASKLMKELVLKTNITRKASYNIGNSSNDVSINVEKYTSLVDGWIDQQPFVDTNNKHISTNDGIFHKSDSFIYIPFSGKSIACIQQQENNYDYCIIKDEQCDVIAKQFATKTSSEKIEILLKKYYGVNELPDTQLICQEIKEHNHHINDFNSTVQSIGEQIETDLI